jgi:hypothetical protein
VAGFKTSHIKQFKHMIYYHGTSNDSITDKILPPSITGCISESGRKKNTDKVFFTTSYKSAMIYAQRAANSYGGKPRVLHVKPIGNIVCLNATHGTEVYYSDYCLVIQ